MCVTADCMGIYSWYAADDGRSHILVRPFFFSVVKQSIQIKLYSTQTTWNTRTHCLNGFSFCEWYSIQLCNRLRLENRVWFVCFSQSTPNQLSRILVYVLGGALCGVPFALLLLLFYYQCASRVKYSLRCMYNVATHVIAEKSIHTHTKTLQKKLRRRTTRYRQISISHLVSPKEPIRYMYIV